MTVNVKQIMEYFLQENGYDGLFLEDKEAGNSCRGCKTDNLMPSEYCLISHNCQPGHFSVDPDDENDWIICEEKDDNQC